MYFRVIACTILGLSLCQPLLAQDNVKMTKKEVAIKTAKILGYTAELAIAGLTFAWLQNESNEPNFSNLLLDIKRKDYQEMAFVAAYQVPFLASIGHSLYGLYTELTPVVKKAVHKIKQRYARIA